MEPLKGCFYQSIQSSIIPNTLFTIDRQINNINLQPQIHIVISRVKLKNNLTLLAISECEGAEEPGVFSSRSVATSPTSLLLPPQLSCCSVDDLLLQSCAGEFDRWLLECGTGVLSWLDGWSVGGWQGCWVYAMYGPGMVPEVWLRKKGYACICGCIGTAPEGMWTGTG
jgi:hypothetical protein